MSAFSDTGGETHAASQWQAFTNAAGTGAPVLDDLDTVAPLTSHASSLGVGTYWFRVRYRDSDDTWSDWSSLTRFVVSNRSISLSVDSATLDLGGTAPGVDIVGSTTLTVATTNPSGYHLDARDDHDTWAADAGGGVTIADWTGTAAAPTVWNAGVGSFAGITVRAATDGRDPKWGDSGGGHPETDFALNRYAALDGSVDARLHDAGDAGTDTIVTTWRATLAPSTPVGSYQAHVYYTATANP